MSKHSLLRKWLRFLYETFFFAWILGFLCPFALRPGFSADTVEVSVIPAADGLAWDGEHLWFASSEGAGAIFRADKKAKILERIQAREFTPYGLAFAKDHLWLCDPNANKICKLNRACRLEEAIPSPAPLPTGLAFDGQRLWVSCKGTPEGNPSIHCVSPRDGSPFHSFKSPHFCDDLAWDGTFIWASCSEAHLLLRFLPSGEELMSFHPPCRYPCGLTYDGDRLWVVDHVLSSGRLFSLDPPTPDLGISTDKPQMEEEASSLGKLFEEGYALVKNGEWAKAVQVWQECVEAWPEGPEPYFNLGSSLDWGGASYDRVIEQYRKCLRLRPAHSLAGLAAYNSGLRALKEGRFLDGVTFMQVAGKYYPAIQSDALFAAAQFAEKAENWDLATELYEKVSGLVGESPCRHLVGMTQEQEKQMLKYLADRCQSQIDVIQIKMLDSTLITGMIVGGEFKGVQYGDSSGENLLLVKTMEGEEIEVDKEKIRFAKFVPKVSPPDLPRGLSLAQVSSSFRPFKPLRRTDLVSLSRQYAADGRAEDAAFRLAVAITEKEPTVGRLEPIALGRPVRPTPRPTRIASVPTPKEPVPTQSPPPTRPPTAPPATRRAPLADNAMPSTSTPSSRESGGDPFWERIPLSKAWESARLFFRRCAPPVLGGALSLFILALLVVPPTQRKRTLQARIKRDFQASRGTCQLRLLQDVLCRIQSSIKSKEKTKAGLEKERRKAERKLSRARDEEKRGRLEREIKRVSGLQAQTDAELDEINCLGAQVEQGIAALTAVGVSDFLKAVKGSEEARQKVSSHFLGLFPPWDDPPDWFDKASKFGG